MKRIEFCLIFLTILIFGTILTGCGKRVDSDQKTDPVLTEDLNSKKSSFDLFGGGMVFNETLLSEGEDVFFSYELPVIAPEKLNDIQLRSVHVTGEGDYQVIPDGVTEGDVYRGWYYYYLHLKVSASLENPASFAVESIDLVIDGSPYSYVPAKMVFCNPKGFRPEVHPDERGILLYEDPPETIMNGLPDDPASPASVTLEVNEDCHFISMEAMSFLDVTNISCFVNGKKVFVSESAPELNISLLQGDHLTISYCLSYQDGISDTDLIKTSRILTFEDRDHVRYFMNEPQGFLIIGFEGDQMIRNYIDREILGE